LRVLRAKTRESRERARKGESRTKRRKGKRKEEEEEEEEKQGPFKRNAFLSANARFRGFIGIEDAVDLVL